MTRQDIDKLFELLAIYRPGDRHLEDKTLRAAWALVLEPYAPEDVKAAVAGYFRESKYWPDVTDISQRCPAVERAPAVLCPPRESDVDKLFALAAEIEARYHAAGLPTPGEALERGELERLANAGKGAAV